MDNELNSSRRRLVAGAAAAAGAAEGAKLEDTIEAFERTVAGEFDELPEQAFYMVGGIDEVIEKAKKLEQE